MSTFAARAFDIGQVDLRTKADTYCCETLALVPNPNDAPVKLLSSQQGVCVFVGDFVHLMVSQSAPSGGVLSCVAGY